MLLAVRNSFLPAILLLAFVGVHPLVADAADATPGLEIGTAAPDFRLTDQAGKQQQLAELLKQGGVAIVFYRSAGW